MKTGIELIAEERLRQINDLGYTFENDDKYTNEELCKVSANYILAKLVRDNEILSLFKGRIINWPWDEKHWKPTPENRIRELQKAGALVCAEIDRLLRKEEKNDS